MTTRLRRLCYPPPAQAGQHISVSSSYLSSDRQLIRMYSSTSLRQSIILSKEDAVPLHLFSLQPVSRGAPLVNPSQRSSCLVNRSQSTRTTPTNPILPNRFQQNITNTLPPVLNVKCFTTDDRSILLKLGTIGVDRDGVPPTGGYGIFGSKASRRVVPCGERGRGRKTCRVGAVELVAGERERGGWDGHRAWGLCQQGRCAAFLIRPNARRSLDAVERYVLQADSTVSFAGHSDPTVPACGATGRSVVAIRLSWFTVFHCLVRAGG